MNNLLRVAAVAAIAIGSVDLAAARECDINVSTKGERIYHMPGQKYYDDTVIQSSHGERWFCSEAEARAAGWRRSKV